MKRQFREFFRFNRQVISEYLAENTIKYSASLSYYTTLSLAPLLVIMLTITGFFFGKEAMTGELYKQASGLVGSDAAYQIQNTIQNIHLAGNKPVTGILSGLVLLVGATGIFGEMQDSLNKIWGLKTKAKKAWWKLLVDRLISFSLIVSIGFVLVVSLLLNAVTAIVSSKLNGLILGAGDALLPFVDLLFSIAITMVVFATIFKVLPDAKIKWKDVFVGALITSILFTLGRILIGFYLGKSNTTIYGAAGSIIIIMLWVYYSSAILYLGAVFTKIYASCYGGKIYPNEYAVWIKTEEIPVPEVTLKQNHE